MDAMTFILGLIGVLIGLALIVALVQKGHEYGLRVFLSREYAGLCFGIILSIITIIAIEPKEPDAFLSGLGVLSVAFSMAVYSNSKKSNWIFGITFTIFQLAMTTCFFMIVVAIANWISQGKERMANNALRHIKGVIE